MKLTNLQKWVIGIMLVFAAFFVFKMMTSGPAGTDKSAVTKSLMNAKALAHACRAYAADHDGAFPPTLDALVPTYVTDRSKLASPLNPGEPEGYIYTPGLKAMGPVNAVMVEDKFAPAQHIRIVAYVDDSARVLNTP